MKQCNPSNIIHQMQIHGRLFQEKQIDQPPVQLKKRMLSKLQVWSLTGRAVESRLKIENQLKLTFDSLNRNHNPNLDSTALTGGQLLR